MKIVEVQAAPDVRAASFCILLLVLLAGLLGSATAGAAESDRQRLFQVDGAMLVTFYDLPSRRFRSIRDSFIRRDFASAIGDLQASIGFLEIELSRTPDVLRKPLSELVASLRTMQPQLETVAVSVQDFDPVFARAHWLLSQHYLSLATTARDQGDYEATGWFLIACAHHMERTALWSNARITPSLEASLIDLYALAARLQDKPGRRWVRNNKPVRLARKTMERLGAHLDRAVRLSPVSHGEQ